LLTLVRVRAMLWPDWEGAGSSFVFSFGCSGSCRLQWPWAGVMLFCYHGFLLSFSVRSVMSLALDRGPGPARQQLCDSPYVRTTNLGRRGLSRGYPSIVIHQTAVYQRPSIVIRSASRTLQFIPPRELPNSFQAMPTVSALAQLLPKHPVKQLHQHPPYH